MIYKGQICDGCGKVFEENDDVVVCPECATPQHRECYNKNSACVNAHMHSEDFSWEGVGGKNPVPAVKEEKVKTIPCPNCGYNNPEGSERCKQCSMKFTLFGFNVVDASNELEEKEKAENSESTDIPEYSAPFAIGEGEGFEENEKEAFKPTIAKDEIEQRLIDTISDTSGFSPDGEDFSFGGPFPRDDKTCTVHTNLLGAFIGSSAMKYIEKFKKADMGRKISFNWAAFFFSPYWFFYRKLIKPGIIFMTIAFCISIISTPYAVEFIENTMPLLDQLTYAASEAEAQAIISQLYEGYMPMLIFMGINLLANLVAGFIANPLYKKYCVNSITEIQNLKNQKNSMAVLLRKGGASPLYALLALLAENIISSIVGMFM